jgi:type VI secretion system secreted protein Hcp
VTKKLDSSSPGLYRDSVAGVFDTKVEIKLTTTTKNMVETFLAFELLDCGVSSYSMSSDGNIPMEHMEFTYQKVIYKPSPLDKSGKIQKGAVVSYDLEKMKAG